jgi:hypothetical protein
MLVVLWLATSLAHADALLPPPAECPAGSFGTSSHAGPWCMPTTCAAAADCERFRVRWGATERARFECRPEALCIRAETARGPRGMSFPREVATASCTATRTCEGDIECTEATRCVIVGQVSDEELAHLLPPLPPPRPAASRSGCGAGLAASSLVVLALVLLAVGLLRGGKRAVDDRIAAMARAGEIRRSAVARELGASGLAALDRYASARADRVRIEADESELVYVFEDAGRSDRSDA